MKFLFTKEDHWLSKWDDFLHSENRASHLIFSDWLKSYSSYGFDYEVFLVLENEVIVGGFGAVIAQSLFFKFYVIPHGPIVCEEYESQLTTIIEQVKQRAEKINCCMVQFSLPVSVNKSIEDQVFDLKKLPPFPAFVKKGKQFNYIYSSYGINWVDFRDCPDTDAFLLNLPLQVRRNIRLSYRNNVNVSYAKDEKECKSAYDIIIQNAKSGNYSVRSFEDFKTTILSLIKKKRAYFIQAEIEGKIKGSCIIIDCGNHLTYITGGTAKEKPDLKLGYLLHWEAVKLSFALGYKGYNISMGGSKGVIEFKSKFNTETIVYENPHYYIELNKMIFTMYKLLNSIFVNYKSQFSKLISFIKKYKQ